MPFLLRNIWMGAMLLFSLITASTFFITQVWQVGLYPPPVCKNWLIPLQAIAAVSLIGISWAVACWVPFAIIMEVSGLIQSVIFACYLTPLLASSSKSWIALRPKASCALRIAALRTRGPFPLQIFLGLLFSMNVSHYSLGAAHSRIKRIMRTLESTPVLREGQFSVSIIWPLSSRNSL
jgi:hypothetical protein